MTVDEDEAELSEADRIPSIEGKKTEDIDYERVSQVARMRVK